MFAVHRRKIILESDTSENRPTGRGSNRSPVRRCLKKTRFFSKKKQKSLSICKKNPNIPYGNAPATVGGKGIFPEKICKIFEKSGNTSRFFAYVRGGSAAKAEFSEKSEFLLSACQKKLNKGMGRSFAVWSSAAKLTRMTHRARVGRGPCCRGSEKSAFFTKERFYSAEVMTRVSKKTGSGGWVSRPTKGEI